MNFDWVGAVALLHGEGKFARILDMKCRLLPGVAHDRLLVFFTGWGMDATPFENMARAVDTLVVWDYRDLTTPLPLPTDKPVHLLAWSMGVWAATQVLDPSALASATAVNGTPWPIDDTRGIPCAIFDGTLATYSEAGLARFRRRMCGGAKGLATFPLPQRTTEELGEELAALQQAITTRPERPFPWTRAYGCSDDKIFPIAAQQAAFSELSVLPGNHWNAELFAQLLRGENP